MSQSNSSLAEKKAKTEIAAVREEHGEDMAVSRKKVRKASGEAAMRDERAKEQPAKKIRKVSGEVDDREEYISAAPGKKVRKTSGEAAMRDERAKEQPAKKIRKVSGEADDREEYISAVPEKKVRKSTDGATRRTKNTSGKNGGQRRPASGSKAGSTSGKRGSTESREEFEARMSRRDEMRARRKAERLRRVRRQRIMMGASAGIIVVAAVVLYIFFTPSMKLSRSLAQGDRYMAQEDYASAQKAYEKALQIDEDSVEAYRCMAGNFLKQQKTLEAEQTYYTGWEKTQDEGLLHSYCIVLYNEAVGEINDKNCTLATVDKCVQVLEQEPANQDALKLMDTCYERLFAVTEENDTCTLFFDEDASQDTCQYTEYESLMRRLIALYQTNPSAELKQILTEYAVIDMPYVRISVPHLSQYAALLAEVNGVAEDGALTETMACLNRAKEVQDYFAKAFTEFEAGNYAYARELVAEESYQKIRDDFINENSGYWEGSIYIPVNREQLVFHREEGKVRFAFLSDQDYENRQGIITVWGTKQEDDGVQRSVISYVPVSESAESSTEYTVQYLYSNVKINGQYVPQMNYRFDTKVTTEEGITTNAIGDWGGEHEWEIDY